MGQGKSAVPVGRELGRTGAASTRKFRKLRACRLKRQVVGSAGLEHWTHFYTDYGVAIQKQFFAYFLKGERNGWDRRPKVQLQVRHLK